MGRWLCGDVPVGLALILAIGVGLLAVNTRSYAAVWQSESRLWAYALRLAPHKPRVLNNYAVTLVKEGHFAEARVWFERAHQAGHAPHLPPWDRLEGERSARTNLKTLDALIAEMHP